MSIKDDFAQYVDGNKLLAPNPVTPGTLSGSDNGPMYTSEYFIMLKRNGALIPSDVQDYGARIGACVDSNGLLNRVPVGQSDGLEQVDDYYGVTNGCMEMGNVGIPRGFLKCLFKYFGDFNNVSPGSFNWTAYIARQLQLVSAIVSAAFPSMKNPLHYLVRIAFLPCYVISAIILLTSCIDTATDQADPRRLAWHLGNNVSKVSLLNFLAYKVWLNRLHRVYPGGMKDVAAIYYQPQPGSPYQKWWIT